MHINIINIKGAVKIIQWNNNKYEQFIITLKYLDLGPALRHFSEVV